MSNFELDYIEIAKAKERLQTAEKNLDRYGNSIKAQAKCLSYYSGLGISSTRSSMQSLGKNLMKESDHVKALWDFLKEMQELVVNAESKAVLAIRDEDGVTVKDWIDLFLDGLGEIDPTGVTSLLTSAGNGIVELLEDWPPATDDVGKFIIGLIGDGASAAKDMFDYLDDGESAWGSLMKSFLDGKHADDYGSFWKALKTEGGSYLDDLVGAGTNVGTKAMWASRVSFIATVLGSGFSNYQEYKDGKISGKRAVGEAIMESAVSIGTGIGIGALVGAAAVACGFVTAPAIAVAAAGVAITFGLDYLTKTLTHGEKEFTEWASDTILDGAESLYDGAVNCFDKLGDTFASWGAALGF